MIGRPTMTWLLAAIALVAFPSAAGGELNPTELSAKGESASAPRITSDGSGNVVAIWRAAEGDTSAIRAASRSEGGSWSSPRRISTPAAGTESPRLAMDRLGNALAVWQRSTGRDSVVQAAIRPDGGTWSEPQNLSGPDEVAFNADVAARAGRLTAVWTVLRDRRTVIEASSRTVDGSWSAAQTISGPVGGYPRPSSPSTIRAQPSRRGAGPTVHFSSCRPPCARRKASGRHRRSCQRRDEARPNHRSRWMRAVTPSSPGYGTMDPGRRRRWHPAPPVERGSPCRTSPSAAATRAGSTWR